MGSAIPKSIVVVGAGVAGGRAVEALRQAGYDGSITLIGAEPHRPYERPPLSKDVLQGKREPAGGHLRATHWYVEQQVELRLGCQATSLDLAASAVNLDDGSNHRFDRLLIATGATVRRLNAPGADLDGIHYLRSIADADRLFADLQRGGRVVVVGLGFIGAEVAASCRQLGLEVVGIEPMALPMSRVLGDTLGQFYATLHQERGVDLRLGEGVAGFRGGADGRVAAVQTSSGATIECQTVVVGVGVRPATDWLIGSGLALDNGVMVDGCCQTNAPAVFAAGDIANWWHADLATRLRLEHDDNAQQQGGAAARAMLGDRAPFTPTPFFWTDQYDLTLQMVGHCPNPARAVLRGRLDDREFSLWLFDDTARLRAVFGVNRFPEISAARRLLQAGAAMSPDEAADISLDLRRLIRQRLAN